MRRSQIAVSCVFLWCTGCLDLDQEAASNSDGKSLDITPMERSQTERKIVRILSDIYGAEHLRATLGSLSAARSSELGNYILDQLSDRERIIASTIASNKDQNINDKAEVALPTPPGAHFCAVGDGQGDNSSDFFCFDAMAFDIPFSFPLHTLHIVETSNIQKIGETGRIMNDICFLAGTYYGIDSNGGLFSINPTTGALAFISSNGDSGMNSLDSDGSSLFAWSNVLYSIDPSTGSFTTFPRSVGHTSSGDVAFDFSTGHLLGTARGNPDYLIDIDAGRSGVGTIIGPLTGVNKWALDFDAAGISLWLGAEDPTTLEISIINKNSGVETYHSVSSTTNTGINGMTAIPLP